MARAWRKNNERGRRLMALETLKRAKFSPKVLKTGNQRSEEQWKERVAKEIEILQKRT